MSDIGVIGVQKVLGGEAYRSLVKGGLAPATVPATPGELEQALVNAEQDPRGAGFKDAIETVKGAAFVVGPAGLAEGIKAIEGMRVGADAISFGGMISHPLLVGAQATGVTKPVNAGRAEYLKDVPTPSQIVAHLDKYVIGQKVAKTIVANAVYSHYKRIAAIADCQKRGVPVPEELLKKNNIFLAGPTGCGKTLIAQTIAKLLKVPFAMADATALTAAGYVGDDVENILVKLVDAADGDVYKAQTGIVYIDEIDKKSKPERENMSITRDVSGADVQDGLLKLVEGTIARIPPQGGRKHPGQEMIDVDTTNILFIAGGAFSGIEQEYARRTQPTGSIGFGATVIDPSKPVDLAEAFGNLEPQDFISYGMKPEFVGRFPAIGGLMPLDIPALKRIITDPVDAPLKQWQGYFAAEGVELIVNSKAIEAIANRAVARRTGARGLQAIFEQMFRQAQFEIPDRPDIVKIVVGADLQPRYYKGKKPKDA